MLPRLPLVAREGGRKAQADEQYPADIALAVPRPDSRGCSFSQLPRAGGERVAAVGDEAEGREQQAQDGDLGDRHMAAACHLDELRQERQEEQRGLGV